MESLAPPHEALIHVRWEMENGHSLREAVRGFLQTSGDNPFKNRVREWVIRKSHGQTAAGAADWHEESPYRSALLDLFERGWDGEPILDALEELDGEIESAAAAELDHFIATLPFRAMLPLLLLQFPAYLLLMLGPMFTEMLRGLGSR